MNTGQRNSSHQQAKKKNKENEHSLRDLLGGIYLKVLDEKEMATYSSVLAWRIPGTGEPDELPSMGSHRVGHD